MRARSAQRCEAATARTPLPGLMSRLPGLVPGNGEAEAAHPHAAGTVGFVRTLYPQEEKEEKK